jgi:hypothetical protein
MAQRPGIDWGRACLSAVCYLRRLWAVVDTPVRPTNGIAGVLNCSAVVRWPASVCSSGLVFNCCRTSSSRPLGVYLPCARPNTIDRITCRMGLAVWAIKARRADGMGGPSDGPSLCPSFRVSVVRSVVLSVGQFPGRKPGPNIGPSVGRSYFCPTFSIATAKIMIM